MKPLEEIELFAWVGEDEFGSGEIGLKQALVPAGYVAMVAVDRSKIDHPFIQAGLAAQAKRFGKKIRLCRFVFAEVLKETEEGS